MADLTPSLIPPPSGVAHRSKTCRTVCGAPCSRLPCRLSTVFGCIFLVIGVLALSLKRQVFNAILDANLQLSPSAMGYDFWHNTDVPVYMRFYFWNVTNADEVVTGKARPLLQELGPYVYRETQVKVNLTWNPNGTVTYMQVKRWFFVPDASFGSLEDNVTTMNVPLLAAAASTKDMGILEKYGFNELLNHIGTQVFVTHTVREFLFDGYSDTLLDIANMAKNFLNISVPFDRFGWFYTRNGSNYYDGVFNMDTGRDTSQLGTLHSWNNTNVTTAFSSPCNMINGTSGEMFPPDVQKTSVQVYSTDICRTLRVPYKTDASVLGLDGYRFEADEMMFALPKDNPENQCFCNGECPPAGLLNETLCRFGVQAFISFPHMLYADPATRSQTVGQRPDVAQHNFSMVLEPVTGVPLAVRARFQINMLLAPNPDIVLFYHVSRAYVPMMWFDNTVDVTPEIAAQLGTVVRTVPRVLSTVSYVILALSLALLVTAMLLGTSRRDGAATPAIVPASANSSIADDLLVKSPPAVEAE